MTTQDLLHIGRDRLVPVYRQREMVLERGQGSRVWDNEGREYVDFGAGIAVCGLGHAHPALVDALTAQAGKLWHTSNVFYSEPPLRLAEELVAASRFASRVFFCNSGAEANEAAIKLVRRYAAAQGRPPERRVIITFHGSFHGRTLAAVTATAQPKYQEGYEPLPQGFRYVDFNDLAQLDAAMAAGDSTGWFCPSRLPMLEQPDSRAMVAAANGSIRYRLSFFICSSLPVPESRPENPVRR